MKENIVMKPDHISENKFQRYVCIHPSSFVSRNGEKWIAEVRLDTINGGQFETEGVRVPSTECDYQFSRSGSRPVHGRLYSPRYPSSYPNNVRCSYHFHGRPKDRVKVVFEEVSLQKGDISCLRRADIIKVFDGRDTNAPAIAMLCNELSVYGPPFAEMAFRCRHRLLQFTANSATPGQGFAATFHFQPPPDSTAADSDRLLKLSFGKAFESLGPEVSATMLLDLFGVDGHRHLAEV
ncbi:Deleted in malignant brain tumors 1 protein [Papilio machaon]|uniref:Deleted in malignant brain tumors 1 protein n=1 Tax=Papilio machaon TaxID=76193 RepID=A0A194QQL8_PAPMA|nr:Deleted in malignant brain tumors 1 protein [Papilio machaon]